MTQLILMPLNVQLSSWGMIDLFCASNVKNSEKKITYVNCQGLSFDFIDWPKQLVWNLCDSYLESIG